MNKYEKAQNKLNIGYLLPDWRDENIAFFRSQLLTKYNTKQFKVHCYLGGDRGAFDWICGEELVWRELGGKNAELAARIIREDQIDLLVDMYGYKSPVSTAILTRKPAKLQVSFVGYFSTTGLKTVEYLFTDKYCDPAAQKENYCTEKLYRLPESHFCYAAPKDAQERKALPFKDNGYVTFGSFYHFTKLPDEFLAVWGRILRAVPNAKLVLKSRIFGSGYGRQETKFRLGRLGFPAERVELIPSGRVQEPADYLGIDIMLDTYPYQGGVYTCDALYMGAPTIVMTGKRHSMRFGYSILKNIGMEECIAFNADDYVRKAAALANHPQKLASLQRSLRARMLKSPLMDARRFVSNVERAYLSIWNNMQDEKRLHKSKKEIALLLQTSLEGLNYIRTKLCANRDSEVVAQLLTDVALAVKNIGGVVISSESLFMCREPVKAIAAGLKEIQKMYRGRRYEDVCENIRDKLIPEVKSLMKML